jgi:uracil phosphoribosyltransferase
MPNVHVSKHPLVLHKTTQLRDKTTPPAQFRRLVRDLTQILFVEATTDLATEPASVHTPLAPHTGARLAHEVSIIPILRAGLGMSEAILELLPEARVWHLGLFRDEDTHKPVTYYNKLHGRPAEMAVVVDPMLATGGSATAALDLLARWGVKSMRFLALIAAPEGVAAVQKQHPDVHIYLAALDTHLNEKCYIVPGLGDAGDRQFNT